jgi:hypothetical protein
MRGLGEKLAGVIAGAVLLAGVVTPSAGAEPTYQPVDVLVSPVFAGFGGIDIDQATHDVFVGAAFLEGGIYKFSPDGARSKFGLNSGYNGVAVNSTTHTVYGLGFGDAISSFDPTGKALGNPFAAEESVPGDLAVNATGDVFAALSADGGIKEFDSKGTLLRIISCAGCPAPESFGSPNAIDFDAAGNMYVADTDNERVLKFSSSGGDPADYSTIAPSVFSTGSSKALAVNPTTGDVFVGGDDGAGYHIKGYDSSGVQFADLGLGLILNPLNRSQIAVDHTTGSVYVTDLIFRQVSSAVVWVFGQIADPVAAASPAINTTQTTTTLNGTVNPGGDTIQDCRFEYGPTTSYGESAQCSEYPGFGADPVAVEADISGLDPDTTYHYRVVATNGAGTAESADEEFTTLVAKPGVSTGGAASVSGSSATISGSVDPLGKPVESCRFEYGPTAAYGSQVPCPTDPGSGSGPVSESLVLSGLAPNMAYHYRLVAANEGGTSEGADASFKTLPSAPAASTGDASGISPIAASLAGSVEPKGAATSYRFEYGTTASYGQSTATAETSGDGSKGVGASLAGLKPSTTYHYRLVASNAGGSVQGAERTFTTQERPKGKLALPPTGTLKGAKASVALECRGGSLAICEGSLVLRARVKQGIRLILVKVGEADYSIDGGKTEAVSVKLNGNGQKVVSQANGKTIGAIAAADGHNRQLRLSASTNRNAHKRR